MTKTIIAITFLATILLILPVASTSIYAPSPSFPVSGAPSGTQAHTLGENCYAFIQAFRINFGTAFANAQSLSVNGVPGHLATLNSAAEETFADTVAGGQKGWIGYTRDASFLPVGAPTMLEIDGFQWGWVTGEVPVFTNWVGGGPNNANNNELYAENNAFGTFWNDIDFNNFNFPERGYFAEFPGACLKIVDIDIKPGSDPNSINTKSNGVVPVAILGSATVDVTTIDVTTLTFGPDAATPAHNGHLEDVNDDGFTDLVTHYKQKEIGLASGDTIACIAGNTNAGIPIDGCDSVKVK